MRFHLSIFHVFLTLIVVLLPLTQVTAQNEAPAPQFLYRNENRLVLVNGYTGETKDLPFEVSQFDRFKWSPDGQYLLAQIRDEANYHYCLNLYVVDEQKWAFDEPLSCANGDAIFSEDGTKLYYSAHEGNNAALWLFDIVNETEQELYRTLEGTELNPDGISSFKWSPTGRYLTFISYHQIMGGTLNKLGVLDTQTKTNFIFADMNSYYASYSPIWSEDDSWFLVTLKERYVTSGTVPFTNHRGDVYVMNSQTGEYYRLTYTPATLETNIHWTEAGNIAYTAIIEEDYELTLEEAMNVELVPREDIVLPEPFDQEEFAASMQRNVMVSPDPNLGAWTSSKQTQQGDTITELNFGSTWQGNSVINFSMPLPESYQYGDNNVLLGWRPSDYPYLIG